MQWILQAIVAFVKTFKVKVRQDAQVNWVLIRYLLDYEGERHERGNRDYLGPNTSINSQKLKKKKALLLNIFSSFLNLFFRSIVDT